MNHFYETTDHLQQFKADKFSTFFKSEAFTFSSACYIIKFRSTLIGNVATHRKVFAPFLFIGHFGKYHNTLCLCPQILHKHCFQFLLGITMVPRENKNNANAKFGGTKSIAVFSEMSYCICSKNDSFLSVFSKAAFLSFTLFLQIINYVS